MSDNEINLNVAWSDIEGEGLVRVVPTDSFHTGVTLVVELAKIAEVQGHDPDIQLSRDKVIITLYSHDAQDVTDRDRKFASAVDELIG